MKRNMIFYILIILFILCVIYFIIMIGIKKVTTSETNVEKILDGVSMTIKEGTLTKDSATIIIQENNNEHYYYDTWFRIDKRENETWRKMEPIDKNYVFDAVAYRIKDNGKLEQKIDWSQLYGKLEDGEYRLLKRVGDRYFWVEFTIH